MEEAFVWPKVNTLLPSLFYGAVLALMGFLLTRYFGGAVGIALTTGSLLVGPFLAIGLYDLSRRREAGERDDRPGVRSCPDALRQDLTPSFTPTQS